MEWVSELLQGTSPAQAVAQAMLLIGVVAAVGIALGSIRIYGINLGVAGVLFAGLATGYFLSRYQIHVDEKVLHFAREFGLILFVYTISG